MRNMTSCCLLSNLSVAFGVEGGGVGWVGDGVVEGRRGQGGALQQVGVCVGSARILKMLLTIIAKRVGRGREGAVDEDGVLGS